jgi:hypothetical protein
MRRDCRPHFIDKDGNSTGLRRVEFGDRSIGERFLQEQLHKNPSILPVSEIDDSFCPLVSLGREINSIDNLFISPQGRLTVVETKLWRNPESTRQVVAQMLDYAKRLSTMTVEELEQACRTARRPAPLDSHPSLFGFMAKQFSEISEQQFIDSVQKALKNARFMLLVVGDGIRENLEDMVKMLHRYPQMHFTFALVEMQIYENDFVPGHLIVPQLVAHTNEIVRAVVRVEGEGDVSVSVSLPDDLDGKKGTTLSEQDFLDSVSDKHAQNIFSRLMTFGKEVGYVHCATKSVSLRMRLGDDGNIRFLRLFNDGRAKVIPFDFQLKKQGVNDRLAIDTAEQLYALFPEISAKPGKPEFSRYLKAVEIGKHLDQFISVYDKVAKKIESISPTHGLADKEEPDEDDG